MDPSIVIPLVTLTGLAFVVLPVVLVELVSAQRRARTPIQVVCPRDGQPAEVFVDASRLALGRWTNAPQEVLSCSRWPAMIAMCDRDCGRQIAAA